MSSVQTEPTQGIESDLASLEHRLEELLGVCARLREENASLRSQHANLVAERTNLLERTERARNRVEAMIAHLKALERE